MKNNNIIIALLHLNLCGINGIMAKLYINNSFAFWFFTGSQIMFIILSALNFFDKD